MNYWPRWVSAIRKRTAHLPLIQMGAYDRLLDHYYAEEKPLPGDLDACCRIAGAVTRPERDAVRSVLAEFFTMDKGVYRNARGDEEIAVAQSKIAAAKENGKRGGRPTGSKIKPTGFSLGNPLETQDEPTAKHHHPHLMVGVEADASTPPIAPAAPSGVVPHIDGEYTGPGDPLPGLAYGATVRPIRAAGMSDADPGHPTFRLLVDAGAVAEEFLAFVPEALKKARPWPWLIAAVVGERERAKATGGVIHKGPLVVATAAKSADTAAQADVQRTQALLAAQASVTSTPEARQEAMAKMRQTRTSLGVA